MENRSKKGHENKRMLGGFNYTMDEMDRDGGNKTQRLYRCDSNYSLSKLIVDNGFENQCCFLNADSSMLLYITGVEVHANFIDKDYAIQIRDHDYDLWAGAYEK